MTISFLVPTAHQKRGIINLEYIPDDETAIHEKLLRDKRLTVRKAFYFDLTDLVTGAFETIDDLVANWKADEIETHFALTFRLGVVSNGYYRLSEKALGTKHPVLITRDYKLTTKTFIAVRDIAIFPRLDALIDEPIIIGGDKEGAIPLEDFERLLAQFPNTAEMNRYADARVSRILRDYLSTMTDAQTRLDTYLKKRRQRKEPPAETRALLPFEIEKFRYVRNRVKEMLTDQAGYTEAQWQRTMVEFLLLIFPKYVAVVRELPIKDYLTNPDKPTTRYCDFALVDANGYLDLVEIKKPMDKFILGTAKYRENYTPRYELSGTIMQVEKYILHLTKWGISGETAINSKYNNVMDGLKIRVTNPKGMIIAGRSNGLSDEQLADFEVIKRKYANLLDIITYDDLLGRLDRIIFKLERFEERGQPVGLESDENL